MWSRVQGSHIFITSIKVEKRSSCRHETGLVPSETIYLYNIYYVKVLINCQVWVQPITRLLVAKQMGQRSHSSLWKGPKPKAMNPWKCEASPKESWQDTKTDQVPNGSKEGKSTHSTHMAQAHATVSSFTQAN